jgi:methyl coenzyme M reductase gamma subunit
LIKKIKHEFTFAKGGKKHTSYITLVKDSLAKELDGPKNLYEPKPEKKASVFKNKETFYPEI